MPRGRRSELTEALDASPRNTAIQIPQPQQNRQQAPPNGSGGRSAGKGRRRRAAAEQRLIELQRLGEAYGEGDDDFCVTPPLTHQIQNQNRRRSRRASRRNSGQEEIDEYLSSGYDTSSSSARNRPQREIVPENLDLALALSLSLDSGDEPLSSRHELEAAIGRHLDMSYENLVKLENVVVAAPEDIVEKLPVSVFKGSEENSHSDEVCAICLGEFVEGDVLTTLPCKHALHQACAKEWLLHYSKTCPVCKYEI